MNKFDNLPVGTVVELVNGMELTLKNKYTSIIGTECYKIKETKKPYWGIAITEIKRVISYPNDMDKLKPGVSVLIRGDLKPGDVVGDFTWHNCDIDFGGRVCKIIAVDTSKRLPYAVQNNDGRTNSFNDIMFEKIIEEPNVELVDGVKALRWLCDGGFLLDRGILIAIKEKRFMHTATCNEKPWEFELSNLSIHDILNGKFEALRELPNWAVEKTQTIELQKVYKHFKGGRYKTIGFATHTETGEQMVMYKAVEDLGVSGTQIFARPLEMFAEWIERDGYQGFRMTLEQQ